MTRDLHVYEKRLIRERLYESCTARTATWNASSDIYMLNDIYIIYIYIYICYIYNLYIYMLYIC